MESRPVGANATELLPESSINENRLADSHVRLSAFYMQKPGSIAPPGFVYVFSR